MLLSHFHVENITKKVEPLEAHIGMHVCHISMSKKSHWRPILGWKDPETSQALCEHPGRCQGEGGLRLRSTPIL